MSKHGGVVSSYTHTQQQIDHYANQYNPNNSAYDARVENEERTKEEAHQDKE